MNNTGKRELVKNDYNAIAQIFSDTYSSIKPCLPYVDDFVSRLKGKNKKVFEVGCGDGQLLNYLSNRGLDVIGLDFSKNLLAIAKKKYPNLTFINNDICDYKTKEKFDGIISKDVLFHIPDEDLVKVLNNIKNMLTKNGKFCVIMDMPKEEGEQIFVEELDERYKIYYNYMSPEKIEKILIDSGFIIDDKVISNNNDEASSYAFGLMVFQCSKNSINFS